MEEELMHFFRSTATLVNSALTSFGGKEGGGDDSRVTFRKEFRQSEADKNFKFCPLSHFFEVSWSANYAKNMAVHNAGFHALETFLSITCDTVFSSLDPSFARGPE